MNSASIASSALAAGALACASTILYAISATMPTYFFGIVLRTMAGETVNIEAQLRRYDYMPMRSRLYGGSLLSKALENGVDFALAPKLRIINLLDYNVRKSHPDFAQPVEIVYRQPPCEMADIELTIHNVELPKFWSKYPDYESLKGDKFLTLLHMLDQGYADTREIEVLSKMSKAHDALNEKYMRSSNVYRI